VRTRLAFDNGCIARSAAVDSGLGRQKEAIMVTQKQGRAAARAAGAMLVVRAGVLFSWELYEVLGADPPPTSDQLYAVFWGVVALWFAVILLVRVGYWPKLAQFAVVRINAWVIAVLVLGGAIQAFAAQDFVGGTVNLIIALLVFVVALSELPESLRNGATPTPSGLPGAPTPTHFTDRPLHPYRRPPRRR
jgi:hypothetical protein